MKFTHTIIHRFVDRDMLMRYHLGLGVGHTYLPRDFEPVRISTENVGGLDEDNDSEPRGEDLEEVQTATTAEKARGLDDVDSDDDELEGGDESDSDHGANESNEEDDDRFAAMDEMYG